jgi:diaminopimelate epimerase
MNVRRHHLDWYEVDLPEPVFMNQDGNRDVWIDLGNPHRVIWSDQEIELLDIPLLGTQLQKEYDVNIEWVNQIKDDWLRIRVFERGAGETLGCGSGAVASAVACIHQQKTSSRRIRVDMPGGHVMVHWPQTDSGRVILEGEAYTVFQGQMYF